MIKEAESSLKIPTTFCSVHQDRSVLSVCLEESCTYRGMFCYQCIKFHYAHLEKTFEIKEFLNSVSEHINELSFDMLPTTPSVSLKELYRHRYEQFSHNKENLLRQKESITEAISKYVNLAIDSAEKKMQGVESKNPLNEGTQAVQELTRYQEKFFDLANLQSEELYDVLIFFSRFITKTPEDKIEFVRGAPARSINTLPKSVAQSVESDLETTCQNLKNSELVLAKLVGILEHLPPDDQQSHIKLTNLKVAQNGPHRRNPQVGQQPQQQSHTQQQQSQQQPPQHQGQQNINNSNNNNNNNFKGNNPPNNFQRGFNNNANNNSSNSNNTSHHPPNEQGNENRKNNSNFNGSSQNQIIPQQGKDQENIPIKINKEPPVPPPFIPQISGGSSFLQKFQQKLIENGSNIGINFASVAPSQNSNQNAINNNKSKKNSVIDKSQSKESCSKGKKTQQTSLNNSIQQTNNNEQIQKKQMKSEIQSVQRLELRSIEHFCDALEVNYNDVWCISFKVTADCLLNGLEHFPIYVYDSSVGSSLEQASIHLMMYEGTGVFNKRVYEQMFTLKKTTKQMSTEETNLMNILEKITLSSPVKLKKNTEYSIVLKNKTQEQEESSSLKQLYILFGDEASSKSDPTDGVLQFVKTNTHNFANTFEKAKLLVSDNESILEPTLTDYFVPFLNIDVSHKPEQPVLQNMNNEPIILKKTPKPAEYEPSNLQQPNHLYNSQSTINNNSNSSSISNINNNINTIPPVQRGFKDFINNFKNGLSGTTTSSINTTINNPPSNSSSSNNNENDFNKYRPSNSSNSNNSNNNNSNANNNNTVNNNNKRKYNSNSNNNSTNSNTYPPNILPYNGPHPQPYNQYNSNSQYPNIQQPAYPPNQQYGNQHYNHSQPINSNNYPPSNFDSYNGSYPQKRQKR